MLSQVTGIPAYFVRKEAKTYGTCQLAEGGDIDGLRLRVVEDVVTSGGQVITSCGDLRERGAIVEHAVCVIDRESGGPQGLADIGVELRALFTMTELKPPASPLTSASQQPKSRRSDAGAALLLAAPGWGAGRVEVAGRTLPSMAANATSTQRSMPGERPRQVVAAEEADRAGLERMALQLAAEHAAVEQQRVQREAREAEAETVEHRDERHRLHLDAGLLVDLLHRDLATASTRRRRSPTG